MSTTRLEAFSDGVVAILITIMVLELRPPHDASFEALRPVLPTFLSYVLSFVFLAIYWNNHHHMLHLTSRVTGGILWANTLRGLEEEEAGALLAENFFRLFPTIPRATP